MEKLVNRAELLEQCAAIVTKDREAQYGPPEGNFGCIADMWSAYLRRHISPADVAAMMVLLKVARLRAGPAKVDTWVDMAGYAACGCELATGGTEHG